MNICHQAHQPAHILSENVHACCTRQQMKRNLSPEEGDHYMRALLACNRHPACFFLICDRRILTVLSNLKFLNATNCVNV